MSVFKTLNSQDIIISPLNLTKGFNVTGNELTLPTIGINKLIGNQTNNNNTGLITQYPQSSIYYNIQHLYYSNYISGSNGEIQIANTGVINLDGTITGANKSNNYDNFSQTNLNPYKYFPTSSYDTLISTINNSNEIIYISSSINPSIGVISIPKMLFGDHILPNSIKIKTKSGSYFDDGEGRLKRDCPLISSSLYVGNIIYSHGIIILTGGNRKEETGEFNILNQEYNLGSGSSKTIGNTDIINFIEDPNINIQFSSSFNIYETQYKCTISENEFNYSYNSTLISNTINDGTLQNFSTGSFFTPYTTTIGLYDEQHQLLIVGKLAQPLPISRITDTNILINIDRI